jgi:hypothetical protein
VQQNPDVGLAKIRRKQGFGDVHPADPGVFQFVADQLFQLLAHVFSHALMPMGVHVSGYNTWVKTVLFLLFAVAASSQPLRVYSEFARIDATGKVTAPAEPREILSPAIVRNGFSSFQVVVDVPKGTPYQLYVAQNPENSVVVTLYRENGDKLEPVTQPASGDTTQVFWMDLWTARDAPVQRIKVEPQLHVNNDWVIYPMEARVVSAIVPDIGRFSAGRPAQEVMGNYLCNRPDVSITNEARSVFTSRERNAQQDVNLAAPVKDELLKLFGSCDAPPSPDPEWYLRIRDYLLRLPQTVR